MLGEDQRDNVPAFIHRMEHFLGGVGLDGKSVLEIGSGRGLLALYSALCGARRVVSLEPELEGASVGVFATQQARIKELQLPIELLRVDIDYPLPYSLRALRGIANSGVGAFFLQARFIIRCHA